MNEGVLTRNVPAAVQGDIGSLPRKKWDTVVVGAGPAGCATALTLARKGRDVVLIDRMSFPREKICGDGFISDTVTLLVELGVWSQIRPFARVSESLRITSHSGVESTLRGRFHALRRSVLDAILARNAVERGVAFVKGSVDAILDDVSGDVHLTVDGVTNAVKASTAVLATGAARRLPRTLGLLEKRKPNALAIRAYVESNRGVEDFHVMFNRRFLPGYGWIFPMGDGVFNVGCGLWRLRGKMSDLRRFFHWFVHENDATRRLLGDVKILSEPKTAPLRCGLESIKSIPGMNVLPVGEVVGATMPFTGEGVGKALGSGVLAAEALDDALRSSDSALLKTYAASLRKSLAPDYRGYLTSQIVFSVPFLSDAVLRLMRRSRPLRRYCELILDDQFPPLSIQPLKRLLRRRESAATR